MNEEVVYEVSISVKTLALVAVAVLALAAFWASLPLVRHAVWRAFFYKPPVRVELERLYRPYRLGDRVKLRVCVVEDPGTPQLVVEYYNSSGVMVYSDRIYVIKGECPTSTLRLREEYGVGRYRVRVTTKSGDLVTELEFEVQPSD